MEFLHECVAIIAIMLGILGGGVYLHTRIDITNKKLNTCKKNCDDKMSEMDKQVVVKLTALDGKIDCIDKAVAVVQTDLKWVIKELGSKNKKE